MWIIFLWFMREGGSIDYDTNTILYHEIKKAGEETKSADAEKQEAANNTEAAAPENEKTVADSAE